MCFFFAHAFFPLPAASLVSCSRFRARREPARAPRRKCGPSQRSVARALFKSRKLASSHGETFRARRGTQAHADPRTGFKNVGRIVHVVQNSATTARMIADCLPTSFSCSSTPRAHAGVLVLVLEYTSCYAGVLVVVLLCSCSCSSAQFSACWKGQVQVP